MSRPATGWAWCSIRAVKEQETGKTRAYRLDYAGADGKRHRLERRTRCELERNVEVLRTRGELARPDRQGVPTIAEFMPVFLDEKHDEVRAGELTAETVETYKCHARRLVAELGAVRLDEFSHEHLVEYRHKLLADRLSDQTVQRHAATLSGLFSSALRRRLITRHPIAESKWRWRKPERKGRALTELEQMRLEAADRDLVDNFPYLPAAIILPLHTGMRPGHRPGATFSLRWDQILWDEGTIVLPKTKGGKFLVLVMTAAVRDELRRWRAICPSATWVFPRKDATGPRRNMTRAWHTLVEKAGLGALRYYDLRHTAATTLLNRGMPIQDVRDYLGHESITTTALYAHPSKASAAVAAKILGAVGRPPDGGEQPEKELNGNLTAEGGHV